MQVGSAAHVAKALGDHASIPNTMESDAKAIKDLYSYPIHNRVEQIINDQFLLHDYRRNWSLTGCRHGDSRSTSRK